MEKTIKYLGLDGHKEKLKKPLQKIGRGFLSSTTVVIYLL